MSQVDLLAARPWRTVTFTTYALSLAFFESVVLEGLVRGGGGDAQILADVAGVSACLGEHGARGAGREYQVEPVAVRHGVFHPKIGVLQGDDDAHLLVGSGNLTFAGWGGNFEMLEHLHPTFAATAFLDAAGFFERMTSHERLRHGAQDRCLEVARSLRRAVVGRSQDGAIRVLHSLDQSLVDQIVGLAEELGGARGLLIASPYWDSGAVVRELRDRLGLKVLSAHAHPGGTARGSAANWPTLDLDRLQPVCLDFAAEDSRRLHAKAFEIVCRRGRLLVTGSANATQAALGAGGNVEACVARLQRQRQVGWTTQPSEPPAPNNDDHDDTEAQVTLGVLRAVLEGDLVQGWVLTSISAGPASLVQLTSHGPVSLGAVDLDVDGRFAFSAPTLEMQAWNVGRLILRVEGEDGRAAQGFVSVAAVAKALRQAGAIAPRLLALISGTETPADVAAILDWLHENPGRLVDANGGFSSASAGPSTAYSEAMVVVADLEEVVTLDGRATTAPDLAPGHHGWRRFIDQILRALRAPRGPFADVDGPDDDTPDDDTPIEEDAAERERRRAAQIARTYDAMEALVHGLLAPDRVERFGLIAFDIVAYICARLDLPEHRAVEWVAKVVGVLPASALPASRLQDVAACCLLLLQDPSDIPGARRVRATLHRFGLKIQAEPPRSDMEASFVRPARPTQTVEALWRRVQDVRTHEEMVADYVAALRSGAPTSTSGALEDYAPNEWPTLKRAFDGGRYRDQILFVGRNAQICPRCQMALPSVEVQKFRSHLVATAANCCGRVVLFEGGAQ